MRSELVEIKRTIIRELSLVGAEFYLNPQNGKVFTAVLMSPDGVTQESIMHLTDLPRTIVSECLATLKSSGFVAMMKHPKKRKKFYRSNIELRIAFQLYLQQYLDALKENIQFTREISIELQDLLNLGQPSPALHYFHQYLLLYQQQNEFVIQHFDLYLSGQQKPPNIDEQRRVEFIMKFFASIQPILDIASQDSDRADLPKNITEPKLDAIKQNYLRQFMNLMEKIEKKPLYPALVNVLYIESDPPTQDRLFSLLGIPRSTLSEALKKVEGDGLIRSVRFARDGKMHYFPHIPRKILLFTKFLTMCRQLQNVLNKLKDMMPRVPKSHSGSQAVIQYLQRAIAEYDTMVDFLLFLEMRLTDTFQLNLL